MYDYEQLNVYQKALELNKRVFDFLQSHKFIDYYLHDQLKRASVSITLNIAEGAGRLSIADRRHFFVISRGSAFESNSIIQIIMNQYLIDDSFILPIQKLLMDITKMLFGLIKNTSFKSPLET